MFKQTVVFAFLLAGVFADENTEALKQELRQKFRAQCENVGAPDKLEEAVNAFINFKTCASNHVNIEQLKREFAEASSVEALDHVFSQICVKSPELKKCLHTLIEGYSPCIERSVRQDLPAFQRLFVRSVDYMCYNGGHRMTLFVAEQGIQCVRDKETAMTSCLSRLMDTIKSLKAGQYISFSEQCAIIDDMSTSIVNVLKQCPGRTPSEIADAILKYLRDMTNCDTIPIAYRSSKTRTDLLALSTILLL